MAYGSRKSERVNFERGIDVHIMGIDGTWRRECTMCDVSQTGARLAVKGTTEGLDLKEFFLLLSATGLAYRRCELVRLSGDQIGVRFARAESAKNSAVRRSAASLVRLPPIDSDTSCSKPKR
ncbi:PilZ domain-containing protein [Afipia massiliensis]|uniref:PilZ domain-containing protein n=1 Tax=Afipia massiliensis TaxID=211460 RepID=A0A4U6BMA8_9BRAD|nr:PilZ domain-containing protein [Afipia massiliensis]TKT71402.1 PilZ domain-containing protein [Afipia massiliensis]